MTSFQEISISLPKAFVDLRREKAKKNTPSFLLRALTVYFVNEEGFRRTPEGLLRWYAARRKDSKIYS
jgi:hypothetical protein